MKKIANISKHTKSTSPKKKNISAATKQAGLRLGRVLVRLSDR